MRHDNNFLTFPERLISMTDTQTDEANFIVLIGIRTLVGLNVQHHQELAIWQKITSEFLVAL